MDMLQTFYSSAVAWGAQYALTLPIAIIILLGGRWLAKKVSRLVRKAMQAQNVDNTIAHFTENILYYLMLAVVLIAALGQLGINITSLLAILGAAGLAVGLALKDSLSNFAAGVMLILMRVFKTGDRVTAAGVTGNVERVTVLYTVFATEDNQRVVVPNALIMGSVITNTNANATRRVDMVFGIGYGDDIDKARDIINKELAADKRVLAEPAPLVAVDELGDSSVNFVVRPWCKSGDYWGFRRDFIERVKKAFDAAGVTIPYPQQDVHMHNAN
ncbi:MAG: mechanosensitive ion channel family protein [Desulfovibrionaceae bacterium]